MTEALRSPVGSRGAFSGAVLWAGFFALIVAAWAGLFLLALDHPAPESVAGALSPSFDVAYWREICAAGVGSAGYAALFAMWALMGAAMMAPTAVPFLATFHGLTVGRQGQAGVFSALLAGYLGVWAGFAAIAAMLQQALAEAALLTPHGILVSPTLTALLLAAAGLYQFSALKHACLTRCRSALPFLMERYRPGLIGAMRMGAEHGAACVGCCWALMLLAFVGGTMNLIWMAGAMVLMAVEKLPGTGQRLTRGLGWALIAAGLWVALRAMA